jgi:hypothetical protein
MGYDDFQRKKTKEKENKDCGDANSNCTPGGGSDKENDVHQLPMDDFWVCGQADIIWPTDKMMKSWGAASVIDRINKKKRGFKREEMVVHDDDDDDDDDTDGGNGSFIFNSSKTFNASEAECFVSRMKQYVPSVPAQVMRPNVPHFKSIARVFMNQSVLQTQRNVPKADVYFSWFLLTSACLSLGAQGCPVDDDDDDTADVNRADGMIPPKIGYRNFELGVLFASHLPKTKSNRRGSNGRRNPRQEPEEQRRVFCFRPHQCTCNGQSKSDGVSLIHLPVPYALPPESYFEEGDYDDDDDDDEIPTSMKENPFFHDILDDSRCVGNMLLTPFGRQQLDGMNFTDDDDGIDESMNAKRQKV